MNQPITHLIHRLISKPELIIFFYLTPFNTGHEYQHQREPKRRGPAANPTQVESRVQLVFADELWIPGVDEWGTQGIAIRCRSCSRVRVGWMVKGLTKRVRVELEILLRYFWLILFVVQNMWEDSFREVGMLILFLFCKRLGNRFLK